MNDPHEMVIVTPRDLEWVCFYTEHLINAERQIARLRMALAAAQADLEANRLFLDVMDGAGITFNDLAPSQALARLREIAASEEVMQ